MTIENIRIYWNPPIDTICFNLMIDNRFQGSLAEPTTKTSKAISLR